MTLLHLAAGATAGLIGVFARSVLRIDEDHPKPVRDNFCFVANRFREAASSRLASPSALPGEAIDLSLPCDVARFSQQLTILQQSLERENVPVITGRSRSSSLPDLQTTSRL